MKRLTASRIRIMAFFFSVLLFPTVMYAQGTWSTAPSDGFTGRYGASSCEVGGKIYVMGGMDGSGLGTFVTRIEVFDPSANSWSTPTTTGTYTARFTPSSVVVNGKIYVMGGISGSFQAPLTSNILEVFDPATNEWSTPTTTGTFTARYGLRAATVNGKIYVMGGGIGTPSAPNPSDVLEIFDPTTNEWSTPTTTGTFTARRSFSASVFNDKIYVFGGRSTTAYLNGVEEFDPNTNSWSTPTTTGISTARSGPASSLLDGRIYVMGGLDGSFLSIVEVFDPTMNEWTTPTTSGVFTERVAPTSDVVGGKIYVMGGQNGTGGGANVNINEVFTPEAGSSVADDVASRELEIFPNPTSGIITVNNATAGKQHITVTNVLGEKVMESTEHGSDFSIDLSKLTAGTYFVRLSGGGSVTTQMIVRQ